MRFLMIFSILLKMMVIMSATKQPIKTHDILSAAAIHVLFSFSWMNTIVSAASAEREGLPSLMNVQKNMVAIIAQQNVKRFG